MLTPIDNVDKLDKRPFDLGLSSLSTLSMGGADVAVRGFHPSRGSFLEVHCTGNSNRDHRLFTGAPKGVK